MKVQPNMRCLLIFLLVAFIAVKSGESSKKGKLPIKVGKPMKDPRIPTNAKGKKISKKKPVTDAKIEDYLDGELEGIKDTYKDRGRNKYETGPAPNFPEVPTTSDATAHESEVNGCRDHPLAQCSKCSRACYGPEHETYLYSFCRKSCGFCNEKTSTFHQYWRLRANSSFTPTWMLKEVKMYHKIDGKVNLAKNGSRAYASSEYSGFKASYAFDNNNDTYWYPDPYGPTHTSENQDYIAYEFPVAVRILGIHILNDAKFPTAAPDAILVEASDDRLTGWDTKWMIRNTERDADKAFRVFECPALWKKYYDSDGIAWCYRLFAQPKTFDEANGICEEEGAQLASVTSEAQKNFILKEVKVCYKAWIGLRKEDKAYYWVDGSDSVYHNWKEEHYTENQRDSDTCVLVNEDGKWELERCEDKNYFVCKQKMHVRSPAKPEEVPNIMPYEPEIPPMIFYYPHVTEPVANTKHLPTGVFPDKDGKFPDDSKVSEIEKEEESNATVTSIFYGQAIKHLDETKGQKAQTGTKPEDWEDPTKFTYKIDAIAKQLGNDMDKNNTDIKPSTPLNIGKLPVLLKVEKPQLDMGKIPGVPIWSPEDGENGSDNKQGVGPPVFKGRPVDNKSQKQQDSQKPTSKENNQNQLPADIEKAGKSNNNNKDASSHSPDPIKQTKEQANKEQDKNPPTGPQQGPAGNIKPPPAQEQGSSNQASVGEAGDQDKETKGKADNEEDEDDEDEDDDDEKENEQDQGTIVPNKPKQAQKQNLNNGKLAGQNKQQQQQQDLNQQQNLNQQQQNLNMQPQQQQQNFQNHLNKLKLGRSQVANNDKMQGIGGSGDSETKEINDILDSMNKD